MLGILLGHIRDCVNVRFQERVAGNSLTLYEEDEQAECSEVVLNTEGVQPILIHLDKPGIHPLLDESIEGLQKRSDYLIICPVGEDIYFLIIEVKSKTPRQWRLQCAAGECLANYIITTIERVRRTEIRSRVKFRHILFTTNQQYIDKQETGKSKRNFYKIDDARPYHAPYIAKTCKVKKPYELKDFLVD